MKNSVFTIMKKELARFFGDKRMVLTTVFLPGIMIYVLYTFMGDALMNNFTTDEEYKPSVAVVNMPEMLSPLFKAANLEIAECKEDSLNTVKKEIEESETDLCVVFPSDFETAVAEYSAADGKAAPNIEIYYNSSSTDSQTGYDVVTALLDGYESAMTNKFDINNTDEKFDLASDEDITGMIFSSMLPMLLLIFMFSGCMAVAPESIAGEKERGTIATMLITPVKRGHIALGKILALSVIALLSGVSSTLGTILSLPKLMGGEANGLIGNVYGVKDYACLAVVILSTVLLLITLISIISAFAKTIKEAQSYVSPLMIVVMLLGVTAMFGSGAKTDLVFYLIPIYNSVQCMVGIFSFDIVPTFIVAAVISNVVYAGLGAFILSKMFNSERIIFNK